MIDINKEIGFRKIIFPDSQPHIIINDFNTDKVKVSINSLDALFTLILVSSAMTKKRLLIINYLMSARYDRIMVEGDSFDLKVVSSLINSLGFEKVQILDCHSDASVLLINNSQNILPAFLWLYYRSLHQNDIVLISPDLGAYKKVPKITPHIMPVEIVQCIKERDLSNGAITLKVLEPEKCTNKHCVIIDDICDGGGTFNAIASQIQPSELDLVVTHGIFSKGLEVLHAFNRIVTTDSICNKEKTNQLYIFNL